MSESGANVLVSVLFFLCVGVYRVLYSFPTRRSSDLYRRLHRGSPRMVRFLTRSGIRRQSFAGFGSRRDERADSSSDRKSTRLNSSHLGISYAVFCLKKKTRRLLMSILRSSLVANSAI